MLKKLILVAMFCCSFSSSAFSQASTVSRPSAAPQIAANPSAFLKDFQTHWDTAKALALAVADAMPAGDRECQGFRSVPVSLEILEDRKSTRLNSSHQIIS